MHIIAVCIMIMLLAVAGLAVRFDIMCSVQGRYDIMRNYMPKVGSLGLDMMLRTCTVQVKRIFRVCISSEFPSTKFRDSLYYLMLKLIETALHAFFTG